MCSKFYISLLTALIQLVIIGAICSRYPANTFSPKSPVDENFMISIAGNMQTYILGQQYNISLSAYNGLRFISFGLTLETENGDSGFADDLGHFEIIDSIETRYSPNCFNMVENTNTNAKTRVNVGWTAPSEPGSGCILIRAMVLQHRDVWYMDDGGLTRQICEEVVDDMESQKTWMPRTPCCACDEARYELIFEGVWSRNLHPKDFPMKTWTTRFSDIVGAAHSWNYIFWEYGVLASQAIREFGEHGSTRLVENEFNTNFKNGNIRTIVKARGPAFPNLKGQSIASVRVDPEHHLLSLASKIEPSPDWIVGISALELCMLNCTWLESRIINLYPWDLGTDAGPSYTSADQPQVPPDVIRRMRSDYPNDPRSPFFDESGTPMKPMAILTVRKQRLYERPCPDEESTQFDVARECYTHPWRLWTECSAKCGEGRQTRTRVYKQPEVAKIYNCDVLMVNIQDRPCLGNQCGESKQPYNTARRNTVDGYMDFDAERLSSSHKSRTARAECQLSDWGHWTPCNQTCGEGKMMRMRHYLNAEGCQNIPFFNLVEYRSCIGRICLSGTEQEDFERRTNYPETELEHFYNKNTENNSRNKDWQATNDDRQNGNYESEIVNEYISSYGKGFEIGNLNKVEIETHHENYEQSTQLQGGYYENTSNNQTSKLTNYQRPYKKQEHYSSSGSDAEIKLDGSFTCFQSLQLFNCSDEVSAANYWFYNYCTKQCMIFTAGTCDRNENKFNSLEMCEQRCHYAKEYELNEAQVFHCHITMAATTKVKRRRKASKRNRHPQ